MLFVRIQADFKPRLFDISEPDTAGQPHPLTEHYCPACDSPLAEDGRIVLVPVGIAPQDRAASEWTNAGCVAVHLTCSGYTETEIEQLTQESHRA